MTRNDTPDKLEWSIRPCSGVDSAQWDWGTSMINNRLVPDHMYTLGITIHTILILTINYSI